MSTLVGLAEAGTPTRRRWLGGWSSGLTAGLLIVGGTWRPAAELALDHVVTEDNEQRPQLSDPLRFHLTENHVELIRGEGDREGSHCLDEVES